MKNADTRALMVIDARAGQPTGIITVADIARAIAEGKDLNDVWVDAVMTTRPATTTASPERFPHHFRRPVPGRRDPLTMTAGNSVRGTDPACRVVCSGSTFSDS